MTSIIEMTLSAAVLILIIAVIRKLFIHKLPKLTFNALWAVVILRLIIPFSFSVNIPSFTDKLNHFPTEALSYSSQNSYINNLESAPETILINGTDTAQSEPLNNETNIDYTAIVKTIWLCGVIASAGYFLIIHFICRRNYRMSVPLESELIKNKLSSLNLKRKIAVKTNDKLAAPITYGIIRPVILIPKKFDFSDENRLEYILSHEIIHIKRFDIVYKWIMTAALCLHWFNPLVWFMYTLANRDIELACDEAVVKRHNGARTEYANILISLEEKRSVPPLTNGFGGNMVTERIVSIMKINKASLISTITAAILVIGSTIIFTSAVNQNNKVKADAANETTETNVISPANENRYNDYEKEIQAISMKESIQPYKSFGLTYDENTSALYFNGNPVRELWDAVTGVLITDNLGTDFPKDAVDVIPIYKNSKLTGLRQATDEEYQRRTDERINKTYQNGLTYYDEGNIHFIFVGGANKKDAPTVSVTPGHISIVLVDKNAYWTFGSYNDISALWDDVEKDCMEMIGLKDTNNGFNETYMGYVMGRVESIIEANIVSVSANENINYSAAMNNTASKTNDNTVEIIDSSSANIIYAVSESASENAVTSVYSIPDTEYNKKFYAVYDEFGIKYDEKTNKLYYKNKAVKYFIDEQRMIHYYDKDGEVSLITTYNINKLNGVKQIKNSEAKKIVDEIINDTALTAVAYSENGYIFDEEFLALYSDYGVTADYDTNCYYYKDKPIAGFCDKGSWIMTDGGARENDGIYLSVIRKDGKIQKVSVISKNEFSDITGITF